MRGASQLVSRIRTKKCNGNTSSQLTGRCSEEARDVSSRDWLCGARPLFAHVLWRWQRGIGGEQRGFEVERLSERRRLRKVVRNAGGVGSTTRREALRKAQPKMCNGGASQIVSRIGDECQR